MKSTNVNSHISRKTISLSSKTLEIAQKNADTYFGGNLSAYVAYLVMQKNYCTNCAFENSRKVEAISNNLGKNSVSEKTILKGL